MGIKSPRLAELDVAMGYRAYWGYCSEGLLGLQESRFWGLKVLFK